MGNWVKQLEFKKENREKEKIRQEKLAGYFFDISKLSFAGLVIGIVLPLFSNVEDLKIWSAVVLGIVLTILAASLANKILK
jgi:predicted ABC-type exoprotein transport system permease subunit